MPLGEFYTPRWLAEIILDEAGYDGAPGGRVLDPSCGPGVFLVLAIERALARGNDLRAILSSIHGYELNPETASLARTNYLAALGESAAGLAPADIPVFCRDAILDPPPGEPFDFVVGNPPWVRWDYLPLDYREATLPLWKHYGLFSLKGFHARLGGGKKDLSMLFTYAAADRLLKPGGTLAFVITQEVFKSKGAGEGFRRFRLGDAGAPLRVRAVHDFVRLRPFQGTANKTAAIVLTKGEETTYPVPYYIWKSAAQATRCLARPIGGLCGSWQTLAEDERRIAGLAGECAYKAVLGANANPYGVFWMEVIRTVSRDLVEVRNLPELGKRPIPSVTATIEPDLLYPALRGADIRRWGAEPRIHVLLVQDPATRRGRAEAEIRDRWPRTFDYLESFRGELLNRALYRKYHLEARHPFYSQFNVGTETLAPFKVVWGRMASDLSAAVVSDWAGLLGRKMLLPLETTAFIGVRTPEEAHYLCAVLNSSPVRAFIRSFSSAGRGFGTPSVLSHLRLPRFDPSSPTHGELARLSTAMHGKADLELEPELDRLVLGL